jgi:hypothetical protein
MEQLIDVLSSWWVGIVAVFYVLDKITKATPTKYDDFVVDVIYNGLKKLLGKKID